MYRQILSQVFIDDDDDHDDDDDDDEEEEEEDDDDDDAYDAYDDEEACVRTCWVEQSASTTARSHFLCL